MRDIRFTVSWVLIGLVFATIQEGYTQCNQPQAIDTSRCGPGSVSLNANASKDLLLWYDAPSGGNLIGSGQAITSPSISTQDSFYVSAYDTTKITRALDFDGNNDYVAIQNYFYSGTGYTEMSVEAWIRTSSAGDHIIASYDRSDFWRFEVNGDAATPGRIGLGIRTSSGIVDFGGTIAVNDNNWHHVAAVFDNGTISLYVDGNLDTSLTTGTSFGLASTRYGFVGTGSEATSFNGTNSPTNYFDGELKEFRLWSVARTQAEIQASMNFCLNGSESGLEVYLPLNDTGSTTTSIDLTKNGNNVVLQNCTLPGAWINAGYPLFSCISCESSRDTLFAQVKLVPSFELGNDTCVSDSITLDAGANYASYLWNTGDTTQTLLVDTSGFYSVTIDTVGSNCTFTDGLTVSVLNKAIGTDTSRCGPGVLSLLATGSTGNYLWYDKNDTLLGSGSQFTTPFLAQSDTFYLVAFDNDSSDQALGFDGVDDYVALNMSYASAGAIPVLTLEAWVRTTVSGQGSTANWSIIDFDRSEYYNLYVRGDNGLVSFSTTADNAAIDDFDAPAGTQVNDGQWHHIVAVYDGTDKIIYIDGVQVATKANPHGGRPLGTGVSRFGFLGDGSEAPGFNGARNNIYFEGDIDEVRIWSIQRNLAQIQAAKDLCLSGTENGLEAYYKMENGSGSNTLTDHSNKGRTGTLFNMNLSTVWLNSGPAVFCSCGESAKDTVIASINPLPNLNLGNDTCVADSLVLDAGAGFSSYTWQDGSSSQTLTVTQSRNYSVTVDSAGLVCSASDTISVSVGIAQEPILTDSSRCGAGIIDLIAQGIGQKYWYAQDTGGTFFAMGDTFSVGPLTSDSVFYVSTQLGSTDALDFDGTNDYVAIASKNYASNSLGEMTVECWIRTSDGTNQVIASYDRNEYWRLEINGAGAGTGQVGFDILTNSGQLDFGGTTRVDDGNWHHIAAVYDSGAVRIYIDGSLDANTTRGTRFGSGNTRFGFLGVGSEATAFNGTRGPTVYFNGDMDEFRLWNVARTQAEIQATMDSCLTGSESGLEVYYRMSQGSGSSLVDFAGSNTGSLFGPTWITNAQVFNCSACSESARIPVTAKVFNGIDSLRAAVSCPGSNGSIVFLESFGGSGAYDLRELSGIFNYSNAFDTGSIKRLVPNGGSFKIEVKDENACLDTVSNVSSRQAPVNVLVGTSVTASCRIPDENNFFYLSGPSNQIIMGVNPAGNDLGVVTATVSINPSAQVFNTNAYLGRSFEVSPQNPALSNVDLRFYFSTAEYNSLVDSSILSNNFSEDDVSSLADLGVTKYDGPDEDDTYDPSTATGLNFISQNSSGTEFGVNFIEVSTTGFSEFWIHAAESGSPLSISLDAFEARQEGDYVLLEWIQLNPQLGALPFSVERMNTATGDFEDIALLEAHEEFTYSYTDKNAKPGSNFYRLYQVDLNGTIHYSNIVEAYLLKDYHATEWQLYPNPAKDQVRISGLSERVWYRVIDPLGRIHIEGSLGGENLESLVNIERLQNGMYHMQLRGMSRQEVLPFQVIR